MLEEKIFADYKEAMKSRDTAKSSVLSFLRAQMLNFAIEKNKKGLDDNDVIAVIRKLIKQHQDSIEQFKKGSRQDLADKETRELKMLDSYLPPQLSVLQIKEIIEEVVSACGAQGIKDMGKVMKEVISRVGSNADSRLASDLVKERLTKPSP